MKTSQANADEIKYQVGQELWVVMQHPRSDEGRYVPISKVGREILTLENGYKVRLRTMNLEKNGYNDIGHCYPSKEAYETLQARQKAWDAIKKAVTYKDKAPETLSLEQLQMVLQTLSEEKPVN